LRIRALGVFAVDLWREITRVLIPRRPSSNAAVEPDGPVPMMSTGTLTSIDESAIAFENQLNVSNL
jgi:hypothetical protein